MKIYNKKGTRSFNEKKLEKALSDFFESNPEKYNEYVIPDNHEQLKATHDKYIIETADIISETTHQKEQSHAEFQEGVKNTIVPDPAGPDLFTPKEDPMNREAPKIRDYVLDDGFSAENIKQAPPSNYDEPTDFKTSFELPDDNILTSDKEKPKDKNIYNSPPPPKKESGPADPDGKAKKKSRKKFTKHAVNAVCVLAGKGIVWWATKDITDAAVAKAISEDQISEASLRLLVYLNDGSRGEVKQFFSQAIGNANDLANFTQEEKDDLTEALDDFLDFKKIEINPGIELGAVFLGIMLDRALKAFVIKSETGSILGQLKDMHKNREYEYSDPAAEGEEHKQDPAAPADKE